MAALVVLLGCGGLSALIAARILEPESLLWFSASVACVGVALLTTGLAVYERSRRSLATVLVSPFAIAAATWLVLFVYRPLELYVAPHHAALSLAQFGFRLEDLTRTVALGGLGCSACCGGYLLALGRGRAVRPSRAAPRPIALSGLGASAVLAAGTVLWLLLFFRQGGFGALVHSPASLRVDQRSSFWAFVGIWLVQGTTLCAFVATLRGRGRTARRVLIAGVALTLLAALATEIRALPALAAVAAAILYVGFRPLGRRQVVVGAVLALGGVLALGVAQQVRAYSVTVDLPEAIRLTANTPMSAMYVSDLSTFDNFVAMQGLVPASVSYLDGRSLAEIPQALVPRSAWPGKPAGLDVEVASYLYPGVPVAVPISLQGELYWNAGLPLVALGAFAVGAALGAIARFGLRAVPGSGLFLVYAVTVPFTHAFLTRGLATMLQNLVFALAGVGIAIWATRPRRWAALVGAARAPGVRT